MGAHGITGAAARAGGWIAIVAASLAAASMAQAASDARILYFEPLPQLSAQAGSVARKASAEGSQQLRFDAYGRHFELSVALNAKLMEQAQVQAENSALRLYQGRLEGVAQSWVRLAAKDRALQGLIWDGTTLYVIEPLSQAADALVSPPGEQAADTIIFRLADVLIEPGSAACANEGTNRAQRADAALDALLRELKSAPTLMQAAGASRRLHISVLGDALFLQRYSNEQDARDAILTRLNNVDGIFSSQLGVEIRLGALSVNDATSAAVSDATSPNTLLRDLAKLRRRTYELHAFGLTHLFTGRDLDGTTIGIAYIDSLCHIEHGAGLTESRNAWLDSLVAAHEIGHNFGADHDGDPHGSCGSTASSGYLMGPAVSGSDTFSQCSLDRIRSSAQSADCLASLPPANVLIPADLGTSRHAIAAPFQWQLQVRNGGGLTAQNVRAELALPAALLIEDATVAGGSCISGAGRVECQLGGIAGDDARTIHLALRSEIAGANTISAQVTADNDSGGADNSGVGIIRIGPEADLALTLQGPASASTVEAFSLDFHIANQASVSADGITVVVQLPAGVSARSASLANGDCAIHDSEVQCTLPSIQAGATASGVVSLSASVSGNIAVLARVSGDYVDPNSANDLADLRIDVTAAAASVAQANAQSSGGGGSLGLLLLLGLIGLGLTGTLRMPA